MTATLAIIILAVVGVILIFQVTMLRRAISGYRALLVESEALAVAIALRISDVQKVLKEAGMNDAATLLKHEMTDRASLQNHMDNYKGKTSE